tara:strand:+ start:583 stop:1032 length:450 start_codon:yes stop_codon:yes gene_type:complete
MSRTIASDIKLGEKLELSVLEKVIKPYFPYAFKIEGLCSEYDIWIPELNDGVEIKYDLTAIKTENLFFESEHNGKKSGINITQSGLWVHYDGTWLFFFTPKAIQNMIKENEIIEQIYRFDINDKRITKGYLVDKEICEKYAHKLMNYEL